VQVVVPVGQGVMAEAPSFQASVNRASDRQVLQVADESLDKAQLSATDEVVQRCSAAIDMIDWSSCPAVERDPNRLSGAWLFCGTRVPISALFQNLEDDASLHDFIEWFPGVGADQA